MPGTHERLAPGLGRGRPQIAGGGRLDWASRIQVDDLPVEVGDLTSLHGACPSPGRRKEPRERTQRDFPVFI